MKRDKLERQSLWWVDTPTSFSLERLLFTKIAPHLRTSGSSYSGSFSCNRIHEIHRETGSSSRGNSTSGQVKCGRVIYFRPIESKVRDQCFFLWKILPAIAAQRDKTRLGRQKERKKESKVHKAARFPVRVRLTFHFIRFNIDPRCKWGDLGDRECKDSEESLLPSLLLAVSLSFVSEFPVILPIGRCLSRPTAKW